MGGLLTAEFRKIFSTKLWWALLIPGAVLALLVNIGGAAVAQVPASELNGAGGTPPIVLLTMAFALSFTTIFAVTHGVIGSTGEYRHRTVTTTFLTAATRGDVLGAKLVAYGALGVLYGLVVVAAGLIGALVGSGAGEFPDAVGLLVISGIGVLAMVIWTLLGVGLGALVSNQVAAVVGALVYLLVVEALLKPLLAAAGVAGVATYLPGNAGDAMLYRVAADRFTAAADGNDALAATLAGLLDVPPWWVSALVLGCYAALFGAAGGWVSRTRDVA